MEAVTEHQALRFAENLTLPDVQVIVMSANMACSHCRQRVFSVISKINGLLDYVVDVSNREVTVRSTVDIKTRNSGLQLQIGVSRKKFGCFF